MSFIDSIELQLKAGDGGPGCSSFRREKFVPMGGPDGGDGGKGGDIILEACDTNSFTALKKYTHRLIKAKNGSSGQGRKKHGSNGQNHIIKVPKGTLVYNLENELLADLVNIGDQFLIAKGGKGGLGNFHFSSSVNRAPTYCQSGLEGESKEIKLELRLIASVGLVGLPNAGKSSLLKSLTHSNPKVDNYAFTTLFPNLGTLKSYDKEIIMADIPGLIEGAHEGQGLGHQFLKHLDRCKLLVHLIECKEDVEQCVEDYHVILNELDESDYEILKKPRITVLSKSDMLNDEQKNDLMKRFEQEGVDVFTISSFTKEGLSSLIKRILESHLS